MAVMGTGTAKPPFVHRDSVGRSIAGGDTGSRKALSSVSMTIWRSHRYNIAVFCPKQEACIWSRTSGFVFHGPGNALSLEWELVVISAWKGGLILLDLYDCCQPMAGKVTSVIGGRGTACYLPGWSRSCMYLLEQNTFMALMLGMLLPWR